jgi:hypothetical protein
MDGKWNTPDDAPASHWLDAKLFLPRLCQKPSHLCSAIQVLEQRYHIYQLLTSVIYSYYGNWGEFGESPELFLRPSLL